MDGKDIKLFSQNKMTYLSVFLFRNDLINDTAEL